MFGIYKFFLGINNNLLYLLSKFVIIIFFLLLPSNVTMSNESNNAWQFKFEERKPKEAFIVQLIKYNRETDADIEFRCRGDIVAVIIRSLAPELSEIEFEAKEDCDKIKKDVSYYYAKED